jgi:hypothetical protein
MFSFRRQSPGRGVAVQEDDCVSASGEQPSLFEFAEKDNVDRVPVCGRNLTLNKTLA